MVEMMESVMHCEVMNPERIQAFNTWVKATNTKLTQINGQRKYGGPPEEWNGPVPGAGCEVFISRLPRDVYEDLLIPLFSSVGPLWEFRLMMNFSGQNRGFAYAKYSSSAVAAQAIFKLHGHVLVPGANISVCYSTEKRNLYIGTLPITMTHDKLLKVLEMMVEGVDSVSLRMDMDGKWATLVFTSHHAASMAKKVLAEAFQKRFALTILVKWQTALNPNHNEPPLTLSKRHLGTIPAPPGLNHSAHVASAPNVPRSPTTAECPTAHLLLSSSSPSVPRAHQLSQEERAMRLHKLCKLLDVVKPRCDVILCHAAVDGFLHFNYKVHIPMVTAPFTGRVMVLPGPCAISVLEDARQAAVQQVMQKFFRGQFSL